MVYEIFLQTVTAALQEQLGSSYSIVIRKIPKNNGILLDSLCISREPDTIAPAIYLNSYYEQFLDGMPLQDIFSDIKKLYLENRTCPAIQLQQFSNLSDIRSRIAWKLIHAGSNRNLLEQIPHLPFLDLAIVFYLHLEQSEHGQMTALIYNEHLELWNITTEELNNLAKNNTPKLLPLTINSMRDVMKDIARSNLGDDFDEEIIDRLLDKNEQDELYVLTNTLGLNGACCLLYEESLSRFADSLNCDLIILPSSIHEVLLLPDSDHLSYEELEQMVLHINRTEVPVEDRLSNQIYHYSRAAGRISVISDATDVLSE